ncbi:hypothetical protein OSTOST_22613, partial [Ostertagia ostertagi]
MANSMDCSCQSDEYGSKFRQPFGIAEQMRGFGLGGAYNPSAFRTFPTGQYIDASGIPIDQLGHLQ